MSAGKTTNSAGKKIRTACPVGGNDKTKDIKIRQAGIDRRPACAVVSGTIDAGDLSPGKEIRARDGKSRDPCARQAVIDRSPVCAIVSGTIDAVVSSGKEIRVGYRKRTSTSRQAGISPDFAIIC